MVKVLVSSAAGAAEPGVRDDVGVRRPDGAEREPRATAGPRPADWALAALVVLAHLTRVRAGQAEDVIAGGGPRS